MEDGLEIGFIDGRAYISWLTQAAAGEGGGGDCPPTVWPDGTQTDGLTRQGELGMTDARALLAESKEGTS